MADRQNSTPRSGGERRRTDPYVGGGERRRSEPYSGGASRRQQSPRRNDVIRCENCGEDYSITYKRCPFCDERPGRGGVTGKRVANTRGGGYGRPASTLRTATWIASFAVVCAALFIIYRFIGSPIFGGGKNPDPQPGASSSQGAASSGASSSGQAGIGDVSIPDGPDTSGATSPEPPVTPPAPAGIEGTVVNVSKGLNVRSGPGRDNDIVANIKNGGTVTVLGEENGWYQIQYDGNGVGYVLKDYVSTADVPVTSNPAPSTPDPAPGGGGTLAPGTRATVVNAGSSGVKIRSGPGTENSVVASASNGGEVTVVGEENGWYRVRYNGSQEGYIRKDFISVK